MKTRQALHPDRGGGIKGCTVSLLPFLRIFKDCKRKGCNVSCFVAGHPQSRSLLENSFDVVQRKLEKLKRQTGVSLQYYKFTGWHPWGREC